jgi:hypothetical protein
MPVHSGIAFRNRSRVCHASAWLGWSLLGAGEEVGGGQGDDGGHGDEERLVAGDGDEPGAEGDGESLGRGDEGLNGRVYAAL